MYKYVIHIHWHKPCPQEADSDGLHLERLVGSALRINVYRNVREGGPGQDAVTTKACLGPGWPIELSPNGSRKQAFICQH